MSRAAYPTAEAESIVVATHAMSTYNPLGYVPTWVGPHGAGKQGMQMRPCSLPFKACKLLPLKTQGRKVGAVFCFTGSG